MSLTLIPFHLHRRHIFVALLIAVVTLGAALRLPLAPAAAHAPFAQFSLPWASAQAFETAALDPSAVEFAQPPATDIGAWHSSTVPLRRAHFAGPFQADLLRVVDGDTVEARVRIWFGQDITTLVRIKGIDAPELHARCAQEARGAQQARDYLIDLAKQKTLVLRDVSVDKYGGRVVASVGLVDAYGTTDVSASMLKQGLVRPYQGGKRDNWCRP
jgi:endonuclease YncB( thermonuclease family)